MMRSLFVTVGIWLVLRSVCLAQSENESVHVSKGITGPRVSQGDYPLTPKNGPWMVLVKSFKGPQAVELANRLAKELREEHQIAAYTAVLRAEDLQIQPASAGTGRVRQADSAAVLAGDCRDEKVAHKLQDKIQAIRPNTITREMVLSYQWEAGPLRTAFCLPNPIAPKVHKKPEPDPLILKLNRGKHSVFNCPGQYTLHALAFHGGIAYTKKAAEEMEKNKETSLLAAAGEHAEQVAEKLRQMGIDAYTFHARDASHVMVGAFGAPSDPQIEQISKQIVGLRIGSWTIPPSPPVVPVPQPQM